MKRTKYLREELKQNVFDTLQKTDERVDIKLNSSDLSSIEDDKAAISVRESERESRFYIDKDEVELFACFILLHIIPGLIVILGYQCLLSFQRMFE